MLMKEKSLGRKPLRSARGISENKRTTRFPGIVEDAKALGVNRIHLWLVLTGRRQSTRLMVRYRALRNEPAFVQPTKIPGLRRVPETQA